MNVVQLDKYYNSLSVSGPSKAAAAGRFVCVGTQNDKKIEAGGAQKTKDFETFQFLPKIGVNTAKIRPPDTPATVVLPGDKDLAMFVSFSCRAFLNKLDE